MTKLTTAQQLWMEALRSGKYQQTTETLQDEKGYCCLGVACQVAKDQGIEVHIVPHSGLISGGELSDQRKVWDWLGLKNSTGYSGGYELTEMNDSGGYNFTELATFIEEHADDLFTHKDRATVDSL